MASTSSFDAASSKLVVARATSLGRVEGDHLAGDQPIEQHPDRGQVLLHGGLGARLPELLDIGGHMNGLDLVE